MTAEYVSAEKHHVHSQDQASDPDAEAVRETEGHHCVIDQKGPYQVGEPQKVTMEVLQNQGKASFAEITLARLAYRARGRVGPERFVVCAAVVITGQPEEARDPKDEERRGKVQKARIPRRLGAEQGMRGTAEDFGRVKRRNVGSKRVVAVLPRRPCGVNQKRAQPQKYHRRRKPPRIPPRRLAEPAAFPHDIRSCHLPLHGRGIRRLRSRRWHGIIYSQEEGRQVGRRRIKGK